jgi:spore coat protein CotF
MKTLQELLKAHEKRLNELTSPLYSDATTPEVRAILIDTCKNAIEQLKRDIDEDESELE